MLDWNDSGDFNGWWWFYAHHLNLSYLQLKHIFLIDDYYNHLLVYKSDKDW